MATGRRVTVLLFLSILGLGVNSCTKQTSDIILADIGSEKMGVAEYERLLAKNNGGWETAKNLPMAEKERFLDLLVKFRLKVLGAYEQGLDKDPEILTEMREYRSTLASSFFLDKEIVRPGLRQMYERRKEEIRASHILIGLPQNPTPGDTLSAWQKAAEIVKRARTGEDFARLVAQFSEDYSARQNGGDLYYFTSGFMVPPFEDACFRLQPGEVSAEPVRTQFGYHVIKLTDRRPSRGQIRASHIMIRFQSPDAPPDDTLKAYNDIRALEDSLLTGTDFAELAKRHSQDVRSAPTGGDLGFFERRRAVQSFDEAAFSMRIGQVSGVVRTPYGYHLIKVTEEKPVPRMQEMQQTLRELYQNYRYTYDYENYLRHYKLVVNLKFNNDVVDTLLSLADSTKVFADSLWDQGISAQSRGKPVFSFASETVVLDSVIGLMKKDIEFSKLELRPENIRKALDRVAERSLIRHRTRDIETEYPEFKQTLKEYEEGILLYKSEQQQVWSKISVNDSLLRDYFQTHRERYTFPDRVNLAEIYVMGDSSKAQYLLDSLKSGMDFDSLASRFTERSGYKEKKGVWGLRPMGENDLTRKASTMDVGQISGIVRYENGYSIIRTLGKEKARLKTYEETQPEIAGHYHDYVANRLEEEWVNALRKEFKVKLQPEKLNSTFVGPPPEKDE